MRELNALIYSSLKDDSTIQTLVGYSITDPRVYKSKTPIKIQVTESKPAYIVYYKMGSSKVYNKIELAQKNDYTYGLEIFAKRDVTVDEIAQYIENTLFNEKQFSTTSYLVRYSFVTRGTMSFDDSRQLYTETVMVHLNKILSL